MCDVSALTSRYNFQKLFSYCKLGTLCMNFLNNAVFLYLLLVGTLTSVSLMFLLLRCTRSLCTSSSHWAAWPPAWRWRIASSSQFIFGFIKVYAESVYIFQSLSSLASSLELGDSSILSIYVGFIKVYAESVYIFQSLSSLASSLEMADSSILSAFNISGRRAHLSLKLMLMQTVLMIAWLFPEITENFSGIRVFGIR